MTEIRIMQKLLFRFVRGVGSHRWALVSFAFPVGH